MTLGPGRTSLVLAGCALGLVFAIAGVARADEPAPAAEPVAKGDMIAVKADGPVTFTVEEVNPETGVSALIRLERRSTDL